MERFSAKQLAGMFIAGAVAGMLLTWIYGPQWGKHAYGDASQVTKKSMARR